MNQPAKAQEPSMEEILASIRRIIADDDAVKPAAKAEPVPVKAAPPPPPPPPAPPAASAPMGQDDIDAMLAGFDAAPAEEEPEPEPGEDVLELTEAMAAPEPEPTPSFRKIDAHQDIVFEEPAAPAPTPVRSAAPVRTAEPEESPLLSATTTAAVNSAFGTLAHTVLVQNAKTLEDLVKEMLRPMLKVWLDDNLPSLVERLVRAEIERVSRGHQG